MPKLFKDSSLLTQKAISGVTGGKIGIPRKSKKKRGNADGNVLNSAADNAVRRSFVRGPSGRDPGSGADSNLRFRPAKPKQGARSNADPVRPTEDEVEKRSKRKRRGKEAALIGDSFISPATFPNLFRR